MAKTHDTPSSLTPGSQPGRIDQSISRAAMLKGTAAAAGALLATPVASSLASSARIAAPAIQRAPSGTVVIWDRAGDLFQVFDSTIASFNKKYPDITVKHVSVDVDAKLPTTLETGVNVPDGAFYEDEFIPIQAAHLYDITEWIAPYKKDIVPFKLQVNTSGGRVIGIPWDLDPGLLFYRVDLLQKAGIDAASITTYDALLNAARTLKSKLGSSLRPIHVEQDPGLTMLQGEMFANQQHTSLVDAAGKLQINTAPYLRWVTWLKQVMDEDLGTHVAYTGPGDLKALDSGVEVFMPWAIWFSYATQFQLKKTTGLWRAMALPAWTAGGARGAIMGGSSFIIPKQAKNPRLAWLWYEHLVFSQDGYSAVYGPNKLYPGGLNTSLPSYRPALKKQLFKNLVSLGGQNLWQVASDTAKDIPGNYYFPTWFTQAQTYYAGYVQKAIGGKMTPKDALAQAAHDIQTKLINRA